MAKGNRCYLCGGKLQRGRCTLCGLDNERMTRRTYRLNVTTPYHIKKQQVAAHKAESMKYAKVYEARQQSLENLGKPLHEQQRIKPVRPINSPNKSNTGRTTYQKEAAREYAKTIRQADTRGGKQQQKLDADKKKWKGVSIAGIIWAAFLVLTEVGGCISEVVDDFSYAAPEYDYTVEEEAIYESTETVSDADYTYVTRELSETGDFYDDVLGPGNYIVGVHIPEGSYTLEIAEGDYVSAYIEDEENSIYMSPSFGEGSYDGYLSCDDVRLYAGAHVEVYGAGTLIFTSQNAQIESMTGMANPMAASASFVAEEALEVVVGSDIPEGIYDLTALSDWSSVCVSYALDGENAYEYYYWLDADTSEHTYRNIVLIDGMTVTFDSCEIQFTPSQWIATDDYETYFMDFYF